MSNKVIGVDIGGSHITSAIIDLETFEIIPNTTFSVKINNKAAAEDILINWSKAINQTISSLDANSQIRIGFAMPGPFDYNAGVALFKENEKYENLYKVSVLNKFQNYISNQNHIKMRFVNDAVAFGIGVSVLGKAKHKEKALALTLGTGLGSVFIKNGMPQLNSEEVPNGGFLWNMPFKNNIADHYFSTRWCIKRYFELSKIEVHGVKAIAEANTEAAHQLFTEFGSNLAEFIYPYLEKFRPNIIVFGGNISLAHELFLPAFDNKIKQLGLDILIEISELMEDAALIGSAKLFDPKFWKDLSKVQ